MAKVSATYFITLDGVVQDPHKWSFPYWSDDTARFKQEELWATDALLLGRKTYEGFAAAWPGRTDPDGFADKFNGMPKHVASGTLKDPAWTNSHVLRGDLATEVRKLKAKPGKDIGVHGSVSVTRALIAAGLLDELRLLVYPLVLGEGDRLFDGSVQARLELVEARPLAKGVVAQVYKVLPPEGQQEQPVANPVYK